VVDGEAGGPDDATHAGGGEIEFEERLGGGAWHRPQFAGLRLLRQVESHPLDVCVGLVQPTEVVCVASGDVLAQIAGKPDRAAGERGSAANQDHPARREVPEVDRVAAKCSADRDRDVLGALRRSVRIPLAEDSEPPDEVTPAVASRGTGVWS